MRDFTKYVHEFESRNGTRYAVSVHDAYGYTCSHDTTTAKLTGCSASFAQTSAGLPDIYESRARALRRARYLYYEMDKEWHDWRASVSNSIHMEFAESTRISY